MAPLFLFLASSFNVELVYMILKGITQFSYTTCDNGKCEVTTAKRQKLCLVWDHSHGSATILMNRIKIKNYKNWSQKSHQDFTQNDRIKVEKIKNEVTDNLGIQVDYSEEPKNDSNVLTLHQHVSVTFHGIKIFKSIYELYNLTSFSLFHKSLSPKFNRDMVFKAGEGAGRSGSFFFFSHDQKFIIKTMTSDELKLFMGLLPAYAKHLRECKNSLLCKIFGVFTVKADHIDEVHIMLIENTLRINDPDRLRYVFDLKGSLVDRTVKGEEIKSPFTTLKDGNFLIATQKMPDLTQMGPLLSRRLQASLYKDIKFLENNSLMDYSLLLGIERAGRDDLNDCRLNRQSFKHTNRLASVSLNEHQDVEDYDDIDIGEVLSSKHRFQHQGKVFHIALIDYLQEWNANKKTERFLKTTFRGKDGKMLSAIEPGKYAKRFRHFIEFNVFS